MHFSSSLRNDLNYNEEKVKEQVVCCIAAVNYPKNVEDLNFHQKLKRLENQAILNERTKENTETLAWETTRKRYKCMEQFYRFLLHV
jgi:hypothetical protein